jgi:hypothetical protein
MNAQLPTAFFDRLRNWSARLLALRSERRASWHVLPAGFGTDEKALRVLAELEDDELSDLSETGQQLRREARRSLHNFRRTWNVEHTFRRRDT